MPAGSRASCTTCRPGRSIPPSLEELAEVAAFSPYHFHRIYCALAGETPADTLTRARLQRAAVMLLETDRPVAAIAHSVGYGSAEALTRAFRATYGLPPGAYRARGGLAEPLPRIATEEDTALFSVTRRDEPGFTLAAIRHIGPYPQIGTVFDRLNAWAGARGLIGAETRFIALYHDEPGPVAEAALRSDAGLTVPPGTPVEGEVRPIDVPPMPVAVLLFQGPYAELEPAYRWLYGEWLPRSGFEPADHPAMEVYLNDPRLLPPAEWLTEILLPLKPG